MGKGMRWDALRHHGRETEAAKPKEKRSRGAWTHVPRAPVREYSDAEKADWAAANPELMLAQSCGRTGRPKTYDEWCYGAAWEKLITDFEPNLFITLAFNCETTPAAAARALRHFQACLDRATVGPKWQKRQNECSRIISIAENLETNLHLHLAVNVAPEHVGAFRALATIVWPEIIPGGDAKIRRVWGVFGMADYITKQITPPDDERVTFSDNVAMPRS